MHSPTILNSHYVVVLVQEVNSGESQNLYHEIKIWINHATTFVNVRPSRQQWYNTEGYYKLKFIVWGMSYATPWRLLENTAARSTYVIRFNTRRSF